MPTESNAAKPSSTARRFLSPFTTTTTAGSDTESISSVSSGANAPSSHPFSAGFQARIASLSRPSTNTSPPVSGTTRSTSNSAMQDASSSTKTKAPRKGHLRTPSAIAFALTGRAAKAEDHADNGGLKGAQVVRTPSDARRGIMKTHLAAKGADTAANVDVGPSAGIGMVYGAAGASEDLAAARRMSLAKRSKAAGGGDPSTIKGSSAQSTTPSTSTITATSEARTESPPSSMIGSAELPMMEECDRCISLPPPPSPVPIIAPPVAPVRPARSLAKAPSLPTIAQNAYVRQEGAVGGAIGVAIPTSPFFRRSAVKSTAAAGLYGAGTKPLRIASRVKVPLTAGAGTGKEGSGNGAAGLGRKGSVGQGRKAALKPIRVKPASVPSDDFTANVRLIDVSQRPAPTAEDDVLITLEFAYSSLPTMQVVGDKADGQSKGAYSLVLPLDVLQRAPGKLLSFVEGHLETLTVGSRAIARNSDGSTATAETDLSTSSRPSMTDGESVESSDVESDTEVGDYGAEDILRNEYLKSLWIPSPTSLSFPYPPSSPPLIPSLPSLPINSHNTLLRNALDTSSLPRSGSGPLAPKGRARTRNQYAQNPSHPYPGASSPIVPPAFSLSLRRRATYIALPPSSCRGVMTEVKVLILRDGAVWGLIGERIVRGRWPWDEVDQDEAEKGREGVEGVEGMKRKAREELEWAGMQSLVAELDLEVGGEVKADSKSIASVIAAALSMPTPPIPSLHLAPTPEPVHSNGSSSESNEIAIAVSADPHPPTATHPGRAAVVPIRRMSLYHKPTQTPPLVPFVSVTPPISGYPPARHEGFPRGEGDVSEAETPAYLSAYPFPDQTIRPGNLVRKSSLKAVQDGHPNMVEDENRNGEGEKTIKPKMSRSNMKQNESEGLIVPLFPAPPPRPVRSALRPESQMAGNSGVKIGEVMRTIKAEKRDDFVRLGQVRVGEVRGAKAGGKGYI